VSRRNGRRMIPGDAEFRRLPDYLKANFGAEYKETYWPTNITCTDRGAHERLLITMARVEEDGWITFAAIPDKRTRSTRASGPNPNAAPGEGSRRASTFVCPACSRTPQVTWPRLRKRIEELARVGVPDVDVSYLDCPQ
jgi:hypothetical protein